MVCHHVVFREIVRGFAGEVFEDAVVHHAYHGLSLGLGRIELGFDPGHRLRQVASAHRLGAAGHVVFPAAGVQGQDPHARNRLDHVGERCRVAGDGLVETAVGVDLGKCGGGHVRRGGGHVACVLLAFGIHHVVVAGNHVDLDAHAAQLGQRVGHVLVALCLAVLGEVAGQK